MRTTGLGWRLVALLLLMLAGLAPASASAVVGTRVATCVRPAASGDTPAGQFARGAPFDCTTPQTRFGAGTFWVRSGPLPAGISPHSAVRFGSLWQQRVDLYVRYADGHIRRLGFTSATASRHLMLGATFQLMLPHHDAAPVQLLWKVTGSLNRRGILNGAAIAGHGEAADAEIGTAALYAAFAGMCLALLIYNLALWAALRQAFQPAYCLMVLCLLAYAFTSSGLLGQLTGIDNNDRLRLNYMLLACSAAAALVFARAFFERRVFAGWLGTYSTLAIAALLTASASFALLAPRYAAITDPVTTATYLLAVSVIVPVLWRGWRLRSNYLWIFALAWGTPVALGGVRILAAFNLIAWHQWIDQSTLVAMALEAALSSLGVAYRIRLLSVERDTAREQEIAARLLAATDPLTGLLNRRAFLDRAIGRDGDQLLILADIDHFKAINETIGHDGGDEVLRVVARALRTAVPPEALVARIGGEEFAIVVPADIGLAPRTLLDTLRSERMPFDLTVTASIGTCVGPLARETDWKAMYRCADRALFEAKAAGRDRVRAGAPLPRAA